MGNGNAGAGECVDYFAETSLHPGLEQSMRKGRRMSLSRTHILVAAACLGLPAGIALAQTSGTWAMDAGTLGANWSTPAHWANGNVPDAGGTVLFTTLPTYTTAPVNVIQDLATISLSRIRYETQITYLVRPLVPANTLTLTGAATLDTPIPSINTISTSFFGQQFQTGIAGSSGLVKTGPGTVTLWSNASTYTGGTHVNGGALVARQYGDAAFGDSSGSITLNGGTLRLTSGGWTSSRLIDLKSGGGTIEATSSGASTLNNAIGGAGGLAKTGSGRLLLNAANTYSGPTNNLAGTLALASNGALTNTTSLTLRETLLLDNSVTNLPDRVNDNAIFTSRGATMLFTGNPGVASSESFGTTHFSRGTSTVSVAPGAGQSAVIHLGSFSRDNSAAGFFRGTGLGAPLGANTSNITLAAAPTLVGGGGTTPTNVSIIPWAFGNTIAGAALNNATNSFVTYGAHGVRPLDISTEYATTIGAAATTDNVRTTAAEIVNSAKTVNSLLVSTGGSVSGAGTLTLTSGALLNLASGSTITAPIDFGTAEGMLLIPSNTTLGGVISGSGGLTKQGGGAATLSAANTYSGTTLIGGGSALFTASVPAGAPSAFGNSNTTVLLAPAGGVGAGTGRIVYAGSGPATFDRDLKVSATTSLNNSVLLPGFGLITAQTLTMNGDIELDATPLILAGTAGSTLFLDGDITGSGGPLTDSGSTSTSVIRINGGNSFTGGVEMQTATWQIGSDTALGNGMLKMTQLSGQPTIQAVGGARIVPNDLVCFSFTSNYFQVSGSNDISFTGSINLSGSFTHNINNSALTTYAGVLHTGGFTKAGTGTLVLSNNNIYSGSTTISSGVLRVTHSGALGTVEAPTIIANGAMLELENNAQTSEAIFVSGTMLSGVGGIKSTAGNNSVGNVTLNADSSIAVSAGRLITGNIEASASAFGVSKLGAGTLSANRVRAGAIEVSEGLLAVSPGRSAGKLSTATSVTIAPAAAFDLGDNDLQINYTSGSPAVAIRGYLQTGYNAGSWNGSGLTSSIASITPNTALGYVDDGMSVSVIYTAAGDANLDRKVNTLDFNELAGNFGAGSGVFWTDGDFDYDGDVDSIDFGLLSGAYGMAMPTPAPLGAVVPEPAMLSWLALCGLALRRRR